MEPQADPVARGQEDEPVEGTHGEAYGERPELPLEREIAKEHETTDQDQVQEDCRRTGRGWNQPAPSRRRRSSYREHRGGAHWRLTGPCSRYSPTPLARRGGWRLSN